MTDDRRFYVYAFFREDGTPYYIGKGTGDRIHSPKRVFKLPPKDRRKILVNGLTEPEAFEYEIALIYCLGRKDLGTGCLHNKTDGGEGTSGSTHAPESRAKISAAFKGKKLTPEHRRKIGAAHVGQKASPETRAKLSKAHKGRKLSPEHIAKIVATHKGSKHSPEHRAKITAKLKGRKASPEALANIRAAFRSPEVRAKRSAAAKARHAARRAVAGQLALAI